MYYRKQQRRQYVIEEEIETNKTHEKGLSSSHGNVEETSVQRKSGNDQLDASTERTKKEGRGRERTVPPSAPSPPHTDRKGISQLPLPNRGEGKQRRSETGTAKTTTSWNGLTTRNEHDGPFEAFGSVDGGYDDFLEGNGMIKNHPSQ